MSFSQSDLYQTVSFLLTSLNFIVHFDSINPVNKYKKKTVPGLSKIQYYVVLFSTIIIYSIIQERNSGDTILFIEMMWRWFKSQPTLSHSGFTLDWSVGHMQNKKVFTLALTPWWEHLWLSFWKGHTRSILASCS